MNSDFSHVRGLAHDIRCILATQRLAADQLERHADPRVRNQIQRIQSAIDLIANACKSTLDRTDPRGGQPALAVVAPLDVMTNILDALYFSIPSALDVMVEADGEITVVTDPSALYRILFNLVDNAIRAMSDGNPHKLWIELSGDRGHCEIRISDDGPGLEARLWLSDFKALRLAALRSGSGLFTALHLADLIGADLTLVETSTRGTTFRLRLPIGGLKPDMIVPERRDAIEPSTQQNCSNDRANQRAPLRQLEERNRS